MQHTKQATQTHKFFCFKIPFVYYISKLLHLLNVISLFNLGSFVMFSLTRFKNFIDALVLTQLSTIVVLFNVILYVIFWEVSFIIFFVSSKGFYLSNEWV